MERRAFITLLAGGLLAVSLPAGAQQVVSYQGRVQWISGQTLILAPDRGGSLRVDLTRVDQSDYQGLGPGARVIVSGVVSEDGNYLIGLSVERVPWSYESP